MCESLEKVIFMLNFNYKLYIWSTLTSFFKHYMTHYEIGTTFYNFIIYTMITSYVIINCK